MPYAQRSRVPATRHLITLQMLDTANQQVTREMMRLGIWGPLLERVGVYLGPKYDGYFGWHCGSPGNIYVPQQTIRSMFDSKGRFTRISDILRHEWAHALAASYSEFTDSPRFDRTFHGSYHDEFPIWEYNPHIHVTEYAADMPAEDFAEIFNFYLRHKGRMPVRFAYKPFIARKWQFVDAIARRLSIGRTHF